MMKPLTVFIGVWFFQLVCYGVGISYDITPLSHLSVRQYAVFPSSLLLFALGLITHKLLLIKYRKESSTNKNSNLRNITAHWIIYALIFAVVSLITALNVIKYGVPPLLLLIFRLKSSYNYIDYGSLKNIIFALCMIMPLLAMTTHNTILRIVTVLTSFAFLTLYVARGPMIQGATQIAFFYILTSKQKIGIKKVITIILTTLFIIIIMGFLGSLRTGTAQMYSALHIKPQFYTLPPGLVWAVAYLSMPLTNLLSLVDNYTNFTWGLASLHTIIPGFIQPYLFQNQDFRFWGTIVSQYFKNPNNNVATYLGAIYVDFGWPGIIFYNFLLGFMSQYFYNKYSNQHLSANKATIIYSIWLSALVLIGFFNIFTLPSFILEITIAIFFGLFNLNFFRPMVYASHAK